MGEGGEWFGTNQRKRNELCWQPPGASFFHDKRQLGRSSANRWLRTQESKLDANKTHFSGDPCTVICTWRKLCTFRSRWTVVWTVKCLLAEFQG